MNGEGAIATSSCVHLHRSTDKVAQDFLAFPGQHRLGMELHAVARVPDVAQYHYRSVVCPRRDNEVRRNARPFDDQRVVARRLERFAHAGQHTRVVVVDPRRLAVRRFVADHLSAEDLPDALMAQAHAQDRDLAAERAHCFVGDARVVGSSWSGRDDDAIELCQLVHAHLVVAKDRGLGAELGHVLDEVVGERVVVVDHCEARHHIASAISMALNIAPAFSSVSSYSRSGLESATTPQPAWTYALPSATTTVRRVMAMSRLPPKLT